ncbi:MAG: YggS family pyridoxal phosphate-dependent enzyme [cyanobacterium endosymbiont of Rhopalodia musculus]|uniref:YggS family pyridoxal phosphate-dependent enzyme n=1 Tax=cyanobacterium endosymbiont of Epithemia clementina EcSB TaxID=3034674 RepID=UPI002480CE6A|nr:YggS family pyridoxal phosphate-dependent enzyme [cyanobacterium endosymbiont of Epithemia clementina EcSB]WGT66677.1 YggS family pyridoxal phosphate-dependent enzyme [cyanobacterium endosymbiont of Epithemia clementina EcSB]
MTIAQRLNRIRQQLPSHVRLIAVTKQVSVPQMRAAYESGIRDFAESRIQEAISKQEQLNDLKDICWHFIGHLQANKVKKVLLHFDWIHSADSLKIVRRLNRLAAESSLSPKVCLQVKILSDPNKYGWIEEELFANLLELENFKSLEIKGLMTILPLGLSKAEILATFKKVKDLAHKIKRQSSLDLNQLSMGMSDDYQLAIQAGATMIRLGRIIFGKRD